MSWTHRLLHLLIEAPVRPMRRLAVYYIALAGATLAVWELAFLPALEARWSGLGLVRAMITALALMLPVAWVYLATRRQRGVDRSVVQTMLALPLVVAGVIVVVQHSLPLSFSLAGIVAAVRFRNTLKDTADMLFVFLAIAVGLTVGAGAASAAATFSVVFNLIVLALWHCHHALLSDATVPAGVVVSADGGVTLADSPAKPGPKKAGKKRRYTGVLSVQVSDVERGKPLVEGVLEQHTKVWRIDEIKKKHDGRSTLRYVVRVDKALPPEFVLDAVLAQAGPYVVGAALN
jgi:uncharacterized protein DUF4956